MFTRSRASFLSAIVVALAFALGAIATTGQCRQAAGTPPATNPNDSLKVLQSRQISRIRVHPKNADIVYVAAQGHVWAPNTDSRVFRSKDGGKTWQKVLFRSDKAVACDLVIDPTTPNVLYAGFWEVYRKPWTLESGGAGSGIFKSTDGGDTWTEITRSPGLPRGTIGIVGITVSPANPDRLWAIVEADDGGVFRSDNGGRTWIKTNEQRNLRQRAWYYSRI